MLHERRLASGRERHHGSREDDNAMADGGSEELEIPQHNLIKERTTKMSSKFASTRLGQIMLEISDRMLKGLEDTAKWSLPQDASDIPLERPLPWILFLILIVVLRFIRISLSGISLVVRGQRIGPHSMVYCIQKKRRHLRAIRFQGLKLILNREIETTTMFKTRRKLNFVEKFLILFGKIFCDPNHYRELPDRFYFNPQLKRINDMDEELARKALYYQKADDADVVQNITVSELLDKYANEDSDDDPDYIPNEDEYNKNSSTSSASSSTDEETAEESVKSSTEIKKEATIQPQKQKISTKLNEEQIKENGKNNQPTKSMALEDDVSGTPTTLGSDNEPMHTPREMPDANEEEEKEQNNATPVATTAVDQQGAPNYSKAMLNHLADPRMKEIKRMSTPGHESAASVKPPPLPSATQAEEKAYRTITTQTAIEIDWTITIKTEITYKKHPPKLENLNCSINLTPASSTEDIFYSPMGSLQDIHSIFHPAPIVKAANSEAQTSTPKENEQYVSFNSDTPVSTAAITHKKHITQTTHNKHNYHHSAKNRNRNRH